MATPHLQPRKGAPDYPGKCRCGLPFRRIVYRQAGLIVFKCPAGRFQRNIPFKPGVG